MITKFEKYNESIKDLLVGPTEEEVWEKLGFPNTINTAEDLIIYIVNYSKVDYLTLKSYSHYYKINNKVYLTINPVGKCCTINQVNFSPLLNIFGIETGGDKKRFVKKILIKMGIIDDVYTMYIDNDVETIE